MPTPMLFPLCCCVVDEGGSIAVDVGSVVTLAGLAATMPVTDIDGVVCTVDVATAATVVAENDVVAALVAPVGVVFIVVSCVFVTGRTDTAIKLPVLRMLVVDVVAGVDAVVAVVLVLAVFVIANVVVVLVVIGEGVTCVVFDIIAVVVIGVGNGDGDGDGSGVGAGDGKGVGTGDGTGVGSGVGAGDGRGVGSGVGKGVGDGVGQYPPVRQCGVLACTNQSKKVHIAQHGLGVLMRCNNQTTDNR
jgi:hypothetical protein